MVHNTSMLPQAINREVIAPPSSVGCLSFKSCLPSCQLHSHPGVEDDPLRCCWSLQNRHERKQNLPEVALPKDSARETYDAPHLRYWSAARGHCCTLVSLALPVRACRGVQVPRHTARSRLIMLCTVLSALAEGPLQDLVHPLRFIAD